MKAGRREQQDSKRRRMQESAWAWFQLSAGKAARRTLVERVQQGSVRFARRLTRTRTAVVLDYAGQNVAFIYSSVDKEIVRFLPLHAAELQGWKGEAP